MPFINQIKNLLFISEFHNSIGNFFETNVQFIRDRLTSVAGKPPDNHRHSKHLSQQKLYDLVLQ